MLPMCYAAPPAFPKSYGLHENDNDTGHTTNLSIIDPSIAFFVKIMPPLSIKILANKSKKRFSLQLPKAGRLWQAGRHAERGESD